MPKPTQAQIDEAADKVLDAAQKYGDKAAIDDYADDEEGALLGLSYEYAELRRQTEGIPDEPKERRSVVVTLKGVKHHFWIDEAKEAVQVLQQALKNV